MSAGGGGGTPLTILIKIDGVEQGQAALKKLAAEFKGIQTEADATGKKASDLGASFQKAGDSGKGIETISTSLDKVDKSGTAVTKTTGNIKKGLDSTKSSASGASTEITKTATSFDKSKSSTEGAVGSYQKYNSEGQKVKQVNTDVSGSIEKVGTSTKGASTSFDAMASATGKLSSESDKSKGSVDALGTAHTTLKGNVDKAKGGLDAHNTVLTTVDQSSTKTAASTTKLGSSFMAQVGSATALIGSATTLWQSYDSLGDAQLRVDKATNTLHATQIKIQTLQTQLNKLTLEGKTGTDEYALVQDKLNLAQDKLLVTQGNLDNAQEDLNVTYSDFAKNIIPQVVTVFGSFTSLIANSKGGLSGLASGLTGAGGAASGLHKVLSMISLTNPFFIAIAAGAALVGAFVTNLFGFRDAVNGLGVALGKAIPLLKPLLDLMGGFGQGVVDSMGMGEKATQSFSDTTDKEMGGVGDTLAGTQSKYIDFSNLHEKTLKTADGQVIGFRTDFLQSIRDIADGMPGLPSSIKSATDQSAAHFDTLVTKAQQAQIDIAKTFSKTVDLGGGDYVTGLPGEGSGFKTPPTRTAGELLGSTMEGQLGQLPAAAKNLKTLTVQDPKNQQTYMNIQKLKDEMKAAGIEGGDLEKIMGILNNRFHATNSVGATTAVEFGRITQSQADARKGMLGVNAAVADWELAYKQAMVQMGLTGSATDRATQSTQGLGSAIPPLTSAFDKATAAGRGREQGTASQTKGEAKLQEMLTASEAGYDAYNEILGDTDKINAVFVSGRDKQNTALKSGQVNTLEATAASQRYTEQLVTAEGAGLEFGKGLLAGNDALNATAASALQTAGQVYYLSDSQNMANMKAASFSQGMQEQALALKTTQVETSKTAGTVQKMADQWKSGEAKSVAYSKGVADQGLAFEKAKVAVEEMRGTVSEMQSEYKSGTAQTLAFNQAYVQQQKTFEEDKLKADALKGTIQAMNEEGASGQAQVVAYNNAYQEQELAFTKSKTAADALRGTIQNMQDNFEVSKVIAYNNAYEEQRLKIEQDKLAIDAMQGTLKALKDDYDLGDASTRAFNKGVVESQIAFQNAKLANDQLEGSIAVLIQDLTDGTQQVLSFDQGMLQMRKTVLDSVSGLSQLEGGVREWHKAVEAGLPQAVAFQTGIENQKKAMDDMKVATAGTLGKIQEMRTQLSSSADQITRFNSGFTEGQQEILTWAQNINTAQGSAAGMQQELDNVASTMKEKLPEGFALSTAKQKEWLAVIAGSPAEVEGIFNQIVEKGKSMGASLAEAMNEGGKKASEAIKGLGKKVGFEITDEIKAGMQPTLIAEGLRSQLSAGLDLLSTEQLDSAGFQQVADGMIGNVEEAMANSPELATVGQSIIQTIQDLKLDPTSITLWDQLQKELETFAPKGSAAYEVMKGFIDKLKDRSGYDAQIKGIQDTQTAMANYQKAIESTQRAVAAYAQATSPAMWENALKPADKSKGQFDWGTDLGIGGMPSPMGGGVQPAAAGPTIDLTAQTAAIEAFKTLVASIPTAVQTAMATAQASFNTLNPMGTLFQPNMTTMLQVLQGLPAGVQQQLATTQTYFDALNPLGKLYQSNFVLMTQTLSQFPAAVQQQMTAAQTGFDALNPMGTLYKTNMTTMLQVLQQFPAAVTQQITLSNTEFNKLGETLTTTVFPKIKTDSATAFAAVTTSATDESKKIPPLFETAATDIDTALKETQNTSATTFEAVVNIGEEEAKKLAPLFDTAAKDIGTALQKVEESSAKTFEAATKSAEDSGESITSAMEDASQAVVDALDEMEQKATDTFQSIVDSAEDATSSVEDLVDAIDQLEDKDITITTHYETTGTPVATGFGPTIVDHPRQLTVGEAGPEYVSVIPLSSSSAKNLSPQQRLQAFGDPGKKRKNPLKNTLQVNNASPYSNYMAKTAGKIPLALGTVNNNNNYDGSNYSNTSMVGSSSMVINGASISSFSNSIDRFSSTIERQNSITNQSTRDTRNYGGDITNNITRQNGGLPSIMMGSSGGSRGGNGFDGLVGALKEAMTQMFSKTNISLTSNTILDGQKINESTSKAFGIKNGTALK